MSCTYTVSQKLLFQRKKENELQMKGDFVFYENQDLLNSRINWLLLSMYLFSGIKVSTLPEVVFDTFYYSSCLTWCFLPTQPIPEVIKNHAQVN